MSTKEMNPTEIIMGGLKAAQDFVDVTFSSDKRELRYTRVVLMPSQRSDSISMARWRKGAGGDGIYSGIPQDAHCAACRVNT